MKLYTPKKHMVDLLFTISLFLVFAASALTVIIISANAYRQIASRTELNYTTRTSLSYIAQKVRQHDTSDSITLGSLQGEEALLIKQGVEDHVYTTYIYYYKGELKELFVKNGADIAPGAGKTIMKISAFTIEPVGSSLYRFSIRTPDGNSASLLVGPQST